MVYNGIDHKSSDIFRLANQMRKENVDVVGDKPVKNDAGEMSMSQEAKQNAWAEHYERLLNVEFDWDPDHLSNEPPLGCPLIPITIDMVKKAISKMKSRKAAGPSGIVVEMIKAAGDTVAIMISDLATAIIHASETWSLTKTNLQRLQRNDLSLIRQICSIKPEDVATVRSSELLAKLELEDLDLILRERRLRWFGHVEPSSGVIRTACDIQIDGRRGQGDPS